MALSRAASIYFHSEIYAFSIACYHGLDKQSTHLKYLVQGPATTILNIYLFFHQNGVTFLCVRLWAGPRVFLSLFLFVDGLVWSPWRVSFVARHSTF